jgi:hypothetical protein
LDDAVALVENSENRHALRHRRHAALAGRGRTDLPRHRRILLFASAARRKRKRDQQQSGEPAHVYSGIQGS